MNGRMINTISRLRRMNAAVRRGGIDHMPSEFPGAPADPDNIRFSPFQYSFLVLCLIIVISEDMPISAEGISSGGVVLL